MTFNSFISVWTQTTPEQCQDLEDICTLLQDKGSKQFSRKYSSLPPIIKWFDVLEDSLVVGMWTFLYVQLIIFVCLINYLFIILNPCCMKLIITLFLHVYHDIYQFQFTYKTAKLCGLDVWKWSLCHINLRLFTDARININRINEISFKFMKAKKKVTTLIRMRLKGGDCKCLTLLFSYSCSN